MWTRSADLSSSASGSSLSSILKLAQGGGDVDMVSSVLTDVIPFLASGGPISGPAIVGEQGPELFVPDQPGQIIPNHKLSMGGGDTHYYTVDARGANDQAAMEVAVQRGIEKARPGIIAESISAHIDYAKRRPSSTR
jgi:hypothetical protein